MKAALIHRYGANDQVKVADVAVPTMGAMDLLVQVRAASVNPVDAKTREGKLKTLLKYRFPLVLGNDLSGVVSDVGDRVTRFKKGDAVYARLDVDRIGAFAEFAVVREGSAALKPTNVTFEEAASLPLVALTAWQALVEIGKLEANQRVLIHAGSGGVGSIAIQLARHLGATVFTTLVLMTGITAAIPYAASALAQLKWRLSDRKQGPTPHFAVDMGVAVVALALSLAFVWYSRNSGDTWYIVWGPFLMAGGAAALGIPVYLAQRGSMSDPAPVPEYK